MPYTRTKVERIVKRVRRLIDQVPFDSEDASTESHSLGSPTTTLSDEFIVGAVQSACRAVVSGAKACHVYHNIKTFTGSGAGQPDLSATEIVRLLRGTVERTESGSSAVRAVQRSVDRARQLEASGRAGSNASPAYSYEDGEMVVYPALGTGDSVTFKYVGVPNLDSDADGSLADELATLLPLDGRFESAIVHYAAAMCYQRLQRMDLHDFAMQIYEDEVAPFLIDTRLASGIDDAEVEIE